VPLRGPSPLLLARCPTELAPRVELDDHGVLRLIGAADSYCGYCLQSLRQIPLEL
jgi:hypothetical protein